MSTETPPRGHRHTRSAAMPGIAASSQNPRNPHHLNQHAHTRNSQTDTKSYSSDQSIQPATPPRTPRKDNENVSQNTVSSAASGTGSKQKSRNKNRPKNVMTSPIATRNDQNNSPFSGVQSAGMPSTKPMNTPSAAAYAGPTFHASPAPSALPIPSFYSKSVPESPGAKGLKSIKGPLATPPHAAPTINQLQREESPLDFFFKADREEKARAHSASQAAAAAGPFQPPIDTQGSRTPPAPSSLTRQGSANKVSTGGIFAMELDGEQNVGTPYGPAFSTPYSERINAARNNRTNRVLAQQSPLAQRPLDRSEALKAYLFSSPSILPSTSEEGPKPPPANPSIVNGYQASPVQLNGHRSAGLSNRPHHSGYQYSPDQKPPHSNSRASGRSSGLRQEVTPSKTPTGPHNRTGVYPKSPTPTRVYGNASFSGAGAVNSVAPQTVAAPFEVTTEHRNLDLQGMEDSLRKILKLDSVASSGVSTFAAVSQPAAATSVPNYVGGRPQPMNGIHKGVMGS